MADAGVWVSLNATEFDGMKVVIPGVKAENEALATECGRLDRLILE